ncbi:hypothetical protein CVT24_010211 [Panaeolus cyanescens]|uniref:CxC5 like cysteine cluster associated with KDZ domain-containing protein n=1 Tax=Panaeolus cyanescens TaxID=181874 RepID=A0A409YPT9_9AGAR|nr:hypothetical protein CVT24_010211 [Panaeolus cyanescens]
MSDLVTFEDIYQRLCNSGGADLPTMLSFETCMAFVRLTSELKRAIIQCQPPGSNPDIPPDTLPRDIQCFLANALGLVDEHVTACWTAFLDTIWAYDPAKHTAVHDAKIFYDHGKNDKLLARALYPPVTFCQNPACLSDDKVLRSTSQSGRQVILYTLEDGACATYHFKLRCSACSTTYHHNYWVQDKVRMYYPGVPDAIEIGKHQFVRRNVAALFLNLMLVSWTSATSSAEIYNTALSKRENIPEDWPFEFDLRPEHIWGSISFLAILEHYAKCDDILQIPHDALEKDRLNDAIKRRNTAFEEEGQPEWAHYCDKCIRFFYNDKGEAESYVCAIVSDGITIGHPCCNVTECEVPPSTKRERFCPGHKYLEEKCAIEECEAKVYGNTLACSDPDHAALYDLWIQRKGANFTWKQKQKAPGSSKPADSIDPEDDNGLGEDIIEVDTVPEEDTECLQRVEGVKQKISARFGRRQTASEQFMVRPCGIVVARATFYGSETIRQTVAMLKQVFRTPGSMPEFFIYDNCCGVYNHLQAQKDPLLETVGFPVDAFHFESKHKKTDTVCQEHCNPRLFPELVNADGTWYFNSSKCEQFNSWLGGFRAIFREMSAERYNFLLDELIMRKNQALLQKLARRGYGPGYFPGLTYSGKKH